MFPRKLSTGILCCALVALCVFSSACSRMRPITRQEVSALLEEMDKAARSEDVETIASLLSSDFRTKVTIEGYGPTVNLSLDRDQYLEQTRQGFSMTDAYDYQRRNTIINIEPDGQTAYVADEVSETVNVGGKVFRSVTTSTSTLKREGGKLTLTFTEGVARLTQGPAVPKQASLY